MSFAENIRLSREVKVGFLAGTEGRDSRMLAASPLTGLPLRTGMDAGGSLPSCELIDEAVEVVIKGDVDELDGCSAATAMM